MYVSVTRTIERLPTLSNEADATTVVFTFRQDREAERHRAARAPLRDPGPQPAALRG